jgi:hypothetical protein
VLIYSSIGLLLCALLFLLLIVMDQAVLLSPAVGLLAYVFWRVVTVGIASPQSGLAVLLVAGGGSLVGLAAARLSGLAGGGAWDFLGVLVAAVVAMSVHALLAEAASPCQLCGADGQSVMFTCPRCQDRVCSRPSCWNARYARCTRCHEREVPLLPIQEQWWVARVGRRVHHGECTHCYKEANETDLRECNQCHWPMCRRCWDYLNGVCPRCEWTLPDLPPALVALTGARRARGGGARTGSRPGRPVPRSVPVAEDPPADEVSQADDLAPRAERSARTRRAPRR